MLILGFLVSIAVARHLGPSDFGFLSYAISATSLIAVAGHMGLNGLVVRSLVKQPEEATSTLGTVFAMKAAAYFLGFLAVVAMAFATERPLSQTFWVLLIVGGSILLKPWEVLSFWFQSKVQAKYSVIPHFTSHVVAAVMKLSLVVVGAGILTFSVVSVVQAIVFALMISVFYVNKSGSHFRAWRFDKLAARELLLKGGLLFAGAALGIINLRVDQVMLKWLRSSSEVGYYSVASTLSEAWYFVPTAIVISVFPRLIQLREINFARYTNRLQQLFDFLFVIALVVAIGVATVAEPFIIFMYGEPYRASATILQIHIFAGVFMFMRAALSKWIIIEDLLVLSLITQGLGAVTNVLLNILMIPRWGGIGAAVATLVSYSISSYFALAVHPRSRPAFMLMTKSLFAPARYPLKLLRDRSA